MQSYYQAKTSLTFLLRRRRSLQLSQPVGVWFGLLRKTPSFLSTTENDAQVLRNHLPDEIGSSFDLVGI
jgi:hypothetical protein